MHINQSILNIMVKLFIILILGGLMIVNPINAQFNGAASHIVVEDPSIFPDGAVVSFGNEKYVLSREGDSTVAGIVNLSPKIEINDYPGQITVPIVKTGFGYALVSTEAGQIVSGDFLTLSVFPGILIKAGNQSEFVVGQALESYTSTEQGRILIDIFIQKRSPLYARTGLKLTDAARESFFDMFAVLQTASQVPANQAFRYVLSGMILLVALLLSLFTFARSAQKGLEAIGRNPLAKYTIMFGVGLNVLFSIVVVLCAVVAAYFVIKL